MSLSAERDRIQKQVDELEQSLSVTQNELDLLSSETDDSEDEQDELGQSPADLLAQKEKIQTAIQNLEDMLGPHSPISVSSSDGSSSSDESDLGLSESVDSCLQLNLVYQQVVQETLDHLETLLVNNQRQQREIMTQISGPIKEPPRDRPTSSLQHPTKMFLGSFLKPYFKDKLTGLGPPANQETRLKAQRMAGCPDDKKLRMKRWESWQKTLLIHSVTRDGLKKLIQPKLSRLDFLTQKLSSASEADKQQLREQIDSLETEMDLLRQKKEEELIGDRFEEHDWQKISNIDFEGTKDAEDIRLFWRNFLHPSINKATWSKEEVQKLKEVSRRHGERHWDRIAEELGSGRTAFMCLQMFQRFVSDSLKRSSWTPEEDSQLRELVEKMRIGNFIPYTQISYFMEGRDPAQLIYRWNQVLDPSLKKGPWTKEEDRLLLQAVSRYGEKCWWKVRLEVPGRTDSSCRDRFVDCLRKGLKRGPFDKQETELLKTLVEKHGVGRWAKIAAEIPHRLDAQCMRTWRKLTQPPKTQKERKKPRTRGGRGEKKAMKGAASARRRQTVKIKKKEEEEEMTEEDEEEEDVVVQYMDSDEDTKERKRKVVQEEEEEEVEEEYVIPPMKDWIPAEQTQNVSFLKFRPAALPSSPDAQDGEHVRSTVVGKSGRSVVVGPPPRVLRWEERHSAAAMMMVTRDQLRAHLSLMEQKFNRNLPRRKGGPLTRVTDRGLDYELQAAVTPWIGNLLFAESRHQTAADVLRERVETSGVSSSSVFVLLLQAMNVDTTGCRDMIEKKKNKLVLQAPPPAASPSRKMDQRSVGKLLQQGKTTRKQRREEDEQRRQMLQQLQEAQQEKLRRHSLSKPRLLHQVLPNVALQVPPNRSPQMSPRRVLLPAPVTFIQFAPPGPPFSVVSTPSLIPLAPPPSPIGPTVTNKHSVLPSSIPLSPSKKEEASCRKKGPGSSEMGRTQGTIRCSSPSNFHQAPPPPPPDSSSPSSESLSLAPPSEPPFLFTSLPLSDHDYIAHNAGPAPKHPDPTHPQKHNHKSGGRKRKEEEEHDVGGARAVVGKRPRKPSLKVREAKEAQTEAKKRSSASSPQRKRAHRSGPKHDDIAQTPPLTQAATLCLPPSQNMWIMTPSGLVPVVPPQHAQLAFVPSEPCSAPLAPPPHAAESLQFVELKPVAVSVNTLNPAPPTCQPKPLPPGFVLSHGSSPQPPAKVVLPYKGVIRVDSPKAPPLRKEGLHFNPSLMFREPPEAVRDWLSGRGGVAVPGARSALPYLPPFVSSLSALSALLRSKKTLTKSALQLLSGANEPPSSQTDPGSAHLPPDLRPAEDQPGSPPDPPASSDQQEEEEEQVKAVRRLVAERFSSNPAYQLLKARFLSCFTVPALLATVQPITKEKLSHRIDREEEEEEDEEDIEEEEQLKKIQKRGRQRRAERSSLQFDDSAVLASHFSGISAASRPAASRPAADPEQVPQNQDMETEPDQNQPM